MSNSLFMSESFFLCEHFTFICQAAGNVLLGASVGLSRQCCALKGNYKATLNIYISDHKFLG